MGDRSAGIVKCEKCGSSLIQDWDEDTYVCLSGHTVYKFTPLGIPTAQELKGTNRLDGAYRAGISQRLNHGRAQRDFDTAKMPALDEMQQAFEEAI
jgi:hypothetical protein